MLIHCSEMPLAYSLADLIVSASIKPEAFGRISVEAQAMQKPIVASDLGGSKETIINSKSGFLFKYDDPRELAKSIHSVISMGKHHCIKLEMKEEEMSLKNLMSTKCVIVHLLNIKNY